MEFSNIFKISILLLCIFSSSYCEPITLTLGAIGALTAAVGLGHTGYCHFKECCKESWTAYNISGLDKELEANVFGQHLVLNIVPKVILEHRNDKNPQKPLVLSFHGSTGTGKNFVSGLIQQQLYPKGSDSKFVHKILSSHEFPSMNKDNLDKYKDKLKELVVKGIKQCKYALFIIDEVDKMPPGLIDTLKPYVDYNEKVDGYDFRKAIFIFMGNTGVEEVNQVAMNFFQAGKPREEITMKSMNKLLKTISYHAGGLYKSALVDHHLIDFYVPFLPLERQHVRQCAKAEFRKKNKPYREKFAKDVDNELEYFPNGHNIYSVSGCKNVARIVQVLF